MLIDKIPIINDIDDLTYGDDYELCFTINRNAEDWNDIHGFVVIGTITDSASKIEFKENNKPINFTKDGWDSFK